MSPDAVTLKTAMTTTDVTVIGAGMVGLSLAIALAKGGLQVTVIEANAAPVQVLEAGYDPRVSALTQASEAFLQRLGAWDLMPKARLSPYRRMFVWDGEGTAHIQFDAAELHRPQLGYIVENSVTLSALRELATTLPNLDLRLGERLAAVAEPQTEADKSHRQLRLQSGAQLQTRLLVAADGAHSPTRKLLGLAIHEWDYQHQAVVTTVKTEKPHQKTAWQRFTEDGPLAFLPLSDAHTCSIVWSTSPAHARQLMALDNAAFCADLSRTFEDSLGRVLSTDRRYSISLAQRHAPVYVTDNMALVGDAAHTIHPLAGQGVNLGFLDAMALAEQVLDGYAKDVDFAECAWLRRYQRQRQGDNLKVMAVMAGFRHLYGDVPPLVHDLRNAGMRWVNACAPLKNRIAMEAMGLK